jgi:hypothetical protein
MNARFVAGLAVAAIPIMSLLGAASATADITIMGKYHNTVGKYNDPPQRPVPWLQVSTMEQYGGLPGHVRSSIFLLLAANFITAVVGVGRYRRRLTPRVRSHRPG